MVKAVACRAKDRGFKSHLPRFVASWTNREVAVPLKHGEAGATPVDAPNEDVAQRSRAPVSEAGSHRFDPCHPRSWEQLASLAPKPTNGRLQDWGTLREGKPTIPHVSTKSPGRQVGRRWSAKPTTRGFDSHPGVQSLQRSLMVKPQAHNLVIASSSLAAATNAQMV